MPLIFWDASALAKQYAPELGSDTINALFESFPPQEMVTTPWGYAETYSILLRRLNRGVLDLPTFTTAVTALQADVIGSPDFNLLSIEDATIFASVSMMRRHNLNATDAVLLTGLLEHVAARPTGSPITVLVAADRRLLRAATAEGLRTLNPEVLPVIDVPAFLASL
jgi:predicted nucleic acid-binding protein